MVWNPRTRKFDETVLEDTKVTDTTEKPAPEQISITSVVEEDTQVEKKTKYIFNPRTRSFDEVVETVVVQKPKGQVKTSTVEESVESKKRDSVQSFNGLVSDIDDFEPKPKLRGSSKTVVSSSTESVSVIDGVPVKSKETTTTTKSWSSQGDKQEETQFTKVKIGKKQTSKSSLYESPVFKRSIRNAETEEGEAVVFECEIDGTPLPEISWEYGRRSVEVPFEGITLFDDEQSKVYSLVVSNPTVKNDHGKVVKCTIRNVAGQMTSSAALSVVKKKTSKKASAKTKTTKGSDNYPAQILKPLSSTRVKSGVNTSLECLASGFPTPSVNWYFNGQELSATSPGVELTYKPVKPGSDTMCAALRIRKATSEHSGIYECVIRNDTGSARSSANLIVTDQKQPQKEPTGFFQVAVICLTSYDISIQIYIYKLKLRTKLSVDF
ncbi:uncharacterized protein LOC144746206 [Ciona intestinalis]